MDQLPREQRFFALLSNTAGGYAFYRDARLRRLIRYRYNNAPLDVGGRFLYLRDDDTRRLLEPRLAADPARRRGLRVPPRAGVQLIGARAAGSRWRRHTSSRPARTLEVWRVAGHQRALDTPRGSRCSARSSSASGTPRTTRRTSSATSRPARSTSRTGVDLPPDRVPRAARPLCLVRLLRSRSRAFDTSREAFLGPYRDWDRPLAVERGSMPGSIAHGWQPIGALQIVARARARRVARGHASSSATPRTRRPPSSTRPARGRRQRRVRKPSSTATETADEVESDLRRPASTWDGAARRAPGRDRRPARRPDGQHLEPVPVHRHVQPVALGIDVRVGDRAGDGLPRFEPGPPRLRPHGPRARPRADPRHRRDPAARRRRLSPVPAADEARQPRRRLRVQRRPRAGSILAVAAYLKETGDVAILDECGAWDNDEGSRDAAPRPPAPLHRLHARPARPARAAADRARRLERLPQPQLSSPRSPAIPSRRRRTGPAASPSRSSSPGCSCLRPTRRRRSPACAATTARPRAAVPRRRR